MGIFKRHGNLNKRIYKFPICTCQRQTNELNRLLDLNYSCYSLNDIFVNILPQEIIIDDHIGSLMLTEYCIGYFTDNEIDHIKFIEYMPIDTDVYDATINMIKKLMVNGVKWEIKEL